MLDVYAVQMWRGAYGQLAFLRNTERSQEESGMVRNPMLRCKTCPLTRDEGV